MDFDYQIIHRPGANNIADYLSRHPVEPAEEANETETYVAFVVSHAIPKSFSLEEIETATAEDEELSYLVRMMRDELGASESQQVGER